MVFLEEGLEDFPVKGAITINYFVQGSDTQDATGKVRFHKTQGYKLHRA